MVELTVPFFNFIYCTIKCTFDGHLDNRIDLLAFVLTMDAKPQFYCNKIYFIQNIKGKFAAV